MECENRKFCRIFTGAYPDAELKYATPKDYMKSL